MTATYLDASVVLRFVLGQEGLLPGWSEIERAVSSALLEVECLRTLDRLRLDGLLDDIAVAERRALVFEVLEGVTLIDVTAVVLRRAAQPLPTRVGTLDAIHLASALLFHEETEEQLTLATHDQALARAGRACGLEVVGA
jgi:uncharacterized protein